MRYLIHVKQEGPVDRPDINASEAMMMREVRTMGCFVAIDCTGDALWEIDQSQRCLLRTIRALTVRGIFDESLHS